MGLKLNEIRDGVVAWFDWAYLELLIEERVVIGMRVPDNRPYVCIQSDGDSSVWVELTKQPGIDRLRIEPGWKLGGFGDWLTDDSYVNDGRNTHIIPVSELARLTAVDTTRPNQRRASISPRGVEAITSEVLNRGGRLLRLDAA